MADSKILIIGGGISGLGLASALLAQGVQCQVFERDDPETLLRQGYDAIKELVEPSVYKQLQSKFSPHAAKSPVLVDPHTLDPLVFLDSYKVYPHSKPLSRFALRQALAHSPERKYKNIVQYNKRFDKFEIIQQNGGEQVKVHFRDGSSAVGDIIVAADGSRSAIREQSGLPGADELPLLNIHCRAKVTDAMRAKMPQVLREQKVMGVAAYGFINFYALYHSPTREELTFDGMVGADDTAPVGDESEFLYFSMACPQAKIGAYDQKKPAIFYYEKLHNYLQNHPEEFSPALLDILNLAKENDNIQHLLVGLFRCSKRPPADWRKAATGRPKEHAHPRVWFVGDAMHSMPPGRGMGANTALVDAAELAPFLTKLVKDGKLGDTESVRAANIAYEAKMLPRAFAWVDASMQAFSLDTESWAGFIGLRIFRSVLTVGHYLQSVGESLRIRSSMEFKF